MRCLEMKYGHQCGVYAYILFAVVVCVLNAVAIRKYMRYKQEVARTFIIPAIASGVMGIVIGLLNLALSKAAGNAVTVFAGISVGACRIFCVLILLKGINERDMRSMPGGRTMIMIAKKLRLI